MNNTDYLDAGYSRARRELALGEGDVFSEAELGVAIKYALAEVLTDRYGGAAVIRSGIRDNSLLLSELRSIAGEELTLLLETARQAHHPVWAEHLNRSLLKSRLVDLAIDALLSERLAPEILLAPGSRSLPPYPPVHALIFSAFTHCAHEVYPLLVDALTAGASSSNWSILAVAAHESWVGEGKLQRAILLDAEADRLLEIDLGPPASVATAQVLALDLTREAESHQQIEQALVGVPFTNPYAGARYLDDKAWTTAVWAQAGLATPAFLAFRQGASDAEMREALADWLCTHDPKLVLKPSDGTEGRGISLIDFTQSEGRANCFVRLNRLIAAGPVLVMEERGQLRYIGPNGPVRFTIRLNVCWDGEGAWAESGYAQAAISPDGIASAGRGGRVMPLPEIWRHLAILDGSPYYPTKEDWTNLLQVAEAGATALAQAIGSYMPRLIGIDLLLDIVDQDGIAPVLLEANPRPAGMSHARFVAPDGPTDEPGVTQRLWSVLPQNRRY